MVSLVEQMLAMHRQLPQALAPQEQTALERQIDALVKELYALTEEEIGDSDDRKKKTL